MQPIWKHVCQCHIAILSQRVLATDENPDEALSLLVIAKCKWHSATKSFWFWITWILFNTEDIELQLAKHVSALGSQHNHGPRQDPPKTVCSYPCCGVKTTTNKTKQNKQTVAHAILSPYGKHLLMHNCKYTGRPRECSAGEWYNCNNNTQDQTFHNPTAQCFALTCFLLLLGVCFWCVFFSSTLRCKQIY